MVITFDLHYPALLALNPESWVSAIIFRTSADPDWDNQRLHATLALMVNALVEGAIAVVEDERIRLRLILDL